MPKPTFFNLPEDKKQTILDTAIEEFIGQGYDGASISQIVLNAGIAKGSFYQYFEDKADLFDHLLEIAGTQKEQFLSVPPLAEVPPFDYLRWLLRGNLEFEVKHPRLAKLVSDVMMRGGQGSHEIRSRMEEATRQFYTRLLRQGIENGHLDPALDLEAATFIFSATSMQLSQYILDHVAVQPDELLSGAQDSDSCGQVEAFYESYLAVLEHGMGSKKGDRSC